MARAEAVDDQGFDPQALRSGARQPQPAVPGDTPAKAKRRRSSPAKKAAPESVEPEAGDDEPYEGDEPDFDEVDLDEALWGGAPEPPSADGPIPPEIDQAINEIAKACAAYDQNDAGNGQRLIAHFGPNLAYVSGLGWLTWRGTHWQRDEGDLEARRWAQLLVERIKREPVYMIATPPQQRVLDRAAVALKLDPDERKPAEADVIDVAKEIRKALNGRKSKRRNFAVTSGNAGRTAAMLAQAASFQSIDQALLDADHRLFNTRNCTLSFSRKPDPEQEEAADVAPRFVWEVETRPNAREDMLTKVAEVSYEPDATFEQWQAFLDRMQPDKTMQRFLQVFHAYAMLIGGNGAQKLAYHYGLGANGKSAFLETLGRLAGSYRTTVSPDTITGEGQRQGQQASPDIARLFNTRFVTVEELPRGVALKEDLVKAFSGGGKMTARFLQKEFFEFVPIFTAVLSGNTKPSISGSDRGIWRRVFIIHWAQTIAEDDKDRLEFPELMKRFDAERSGILNWLIEGARLYLANGLMAYVPKEVTAFTEDYRRERDNISVFCEAMIIPMPGERVQAGHVYARYLEWCTANGLVAAKQRTFGERLGDLGYRKETGRLYQYLDIQLRTLPVDGGLSSAVGVRQSATHAPPPRQAGDPGPSDDDIPL